MTKILAMLKIAARIYMLIAIPAIGMIVFVLLCSDRIESALMLERQDQTRKIVELGKSVADSYIARAKAGEFTQQEAQRRAISTFSALKYDGNNYLYALKWDGTMIAHPDASTIGKDVTTQTDARGEKVFSKLLAVADKTTDYFQYYWRDTDGQEKLKVTYAINIPEWKWIIASGIFADSVKTTVSKIENGLYVASAIIIAIAALAALVIGNSITGPINALNRAMDKLAGGDNSGEVGMGERRDEIGSMARTVAVFQENAREMERMRAERAETERRMAAQKTDMMNRLADDLNRSVGEIVNTVSSAAVQLQSNSEQLASLSDHTNRLATAVAAATEEASTNVSSVASATEELSASIGEINRQVADSSQAAQEAVREVERTNSTVSTLSDAAMQIGDVVRLIQDIAGQTNLLALNATIEAARAGEAGKGFAVVASEVKGLANQTARATDEISTKIVTIQTVSTEAATAFQVVGSSIARIDKIAEDVATAIGEQTSATREISNNIQQVSAGTNEVSNSITSVTEAAQESHRAASEVLSASQELMKQAQVLRGEIEGFVTKIRTA